MIPLVLGAAVLPLLMMSLYCFTQVCMTDHASICCIANFVHSCVVCQPFVWHVSFAHNVRYNADELMLTCWSWYSASWCTLVQWCTSLWVANNTLHSNTAGHQPCLVSGADSLDLYHHHCLHLQWLCTGAVNKTTYFNQTQSMAFPANTSDPYYKNWNKLANNPILIEVPPGGNNSQFR